MSSQDNLTDDTTDFGYERVKTAEKAGRVREVFDSVAAQYDLMNDLMSGGLHRLWKRFTIELSAVRSGQTVLDIAGGTGDLAAKFSKIVGADGKVGAGGRVTRPQHKHCKDHRLRQYVHHNRNWP
jgi:demethylmenaquinone methyltransferase/2-methoxy-6-polyprenyl-1,4-benzoquinol methylase